MEIEEIVCEACHESILRPGPLHTAAADTKSTDGPLYVTCGHLYHQKCGYKLCKESTIVNEYNIRVAQCKHPGCTKRFGENQFSLIEFTTRPQCTTQPPADSQVTLLQVQNQLRVATDMSSRVTKKAVDLANEVNTLKARNKQLEVELKSSESRYSMLMDQRVATLLDTNTGPDEITTPMMHRQTVPSSSPKQQQQQRLQQQQQQQQQPIGRQQQSPQQTIASDAGKVNEPKHQSQLHRVNPEQSPQVPYSNTSQKSSRRSELSDNDGSVSTNGGSRSSKIYKPTYQQTAHSAAQPRKKRNTGVEEENSHYEYSRRFGTKSYELRPWYPTNFYPEYYTVAARQTMKNVYKKVIFAYNILIIGDGHANGIAEFILSGRNFQNDIDTDIYRRNMSIKNLIETLKGLNRIPERIMISIGNFDVAQKMPRTIFYDHMVELAQLLSYHKVKELFFLPLIKYPPPQNEEAYEAISAVFDNDWGQPSHAKYVPAVPAFGDLDNYTPSVDKFGPFYAKEQYASSVNKLRELYVPIPARVQVKYNVPMPPPENVPQLAYKHCSVGKLEPVNGARTLSSPKASTGRKKW
ncbi:uncharacterized protein LOC135847730 isoform X8 [Planococcus citri]|uniref:uncharacterized protein LOC135847730 isoform X8 n=1 Tax=Planococcus citri TaxID=170843 RepID=UPI0031F815B9